MRARRLLALSFTLLSTACRDRPRAVAPRDAAPRADVHVAANASPQGGSARRPSPRLAELDARLRAMESLANARTDDWLTWERVAIDYITRARLSSDYGDYARADAALARAFERATPGTGPFLTRARLNYTVHRVGRVEADLDALRYALVRPDERAAIAHLRAEAAFYAGRYDDARRLYTENLTAERSVTNLVAMAQFQWKTGHFTEAEAMVNEAEVTARREDEGYRSWVCLVRGMMELDRGRWDAALAAFREGLRLQPASTMFLEHIAEVLMFQGHDEESRLMYVDLVETTDDPEFIDCLAQLYERRGDTAQAAPLVARARANYEARLRIMPEATAGHAIEFFLRRDPQRAVPIAELNRDARPGGEAQVKLAEAYLVAHRTADAQRVIEAVLASPWNTADAHATAARVYATLGDTVRASAQRALALALNPHSLDDDTDAGR